MSAALGGNPSIVAALLEKKAGLNVVSDVSVLVMQDLYCCANPTSPDMIPRGATRQDMTLLIIAMLCLTLRRSVGRLSWRLLLGDTTQWWLCS
jgi:hypothetical protein